MCSSDFDDGFCGSRGDLYRKLSDSCKNTGVSHEIIPVRQTGTGNRSDSGVFVFICSGIACFFDFNRENVINRRFYEFITFYKNGVKFLMRIYSNTKEIVSAHSTPVV